MENQTPHKRRPRYSGTHPKSYQEKYKELQPEKYSETVSKVMQKGSTPAGMHISICVQEILDFLQIKPGQKGLDATLGYGGHTKEMLKCLNGQGHLYALDVDPIESAKTAKRLEDAGYGPDLLTVRLQNFAQIDKVAAEVGNFDFILADLGVSSMQIDNPERGFSYKTEGPLDLRMNPQIGISAAQRLREISKEELCGMLIENADEVYAEEIAEQVIITLKKGEKIETTSQLRNVIEEALSKVSDVRIRESANKGAGRREADYNNAGNKEIDRRGAISKEHVRKEAIKKSCQRTFQALRIDVNNEYEVLYELLEKLPQVLNPGGRVAILTFHSGEDRLVKKSFQKYLREGAYCEIAKEAIRASKEECFKNPRAQSAKLRWAIRA